MNTVVTAQEVTLPTQEEKASRLTRQRVRSAWLFLAPMLVVLALVAGWPLAPHHLVRLHRRQSVRTSTPLSSSAF